MDNETKERVKQNILRRRQNAREQITHLDKGRNLYKSHGIKHMAVKSDDAIKQSLLNLHKINDQIDQIMADLSLEAEPDNKLGAAIEGLRHAAQFITDYGDELLNPPTAKGQYDDFEEGGAGFSSPSELFKQQMADRRSASDDEDNAKVEAQTDANYHAATGEDLKRDSNGQFASFLRGSIQTIAPQQERGYNLGKRTIWNKG